MKFVHVLIYPATPHLETELELIQNELDVGQRVEVLTCKGQLPYCIINPHHEKGVCRKCVSKTNMGLKQIRGDITKKNILRSDLPLAYAIQSQEDLRRVVYGNVNIGIGAMSDLISRYGFRFDMVGKELLINRILRSEVMILDSLASLSVDSQTQIVLFNGRFSSFRTIVEFCQTRRVRYKCHERAGGVERYTCREGAIPHDIESAYIEMMSLWNRAANGESIALDWFLGRRNKVVQNWIVFTKDQTEGLLPKEFDQHKRNVVIFNSTIEEYETVDCWKNHLFDDEVVGLKVLMEMFSSWDDFHFYVRLHPNLKNFLDGPQMKKIMRFACPNNFTIIDPADSIHSYALIDACEKVVTFGSTIGIEASFWGKPSILLGRSFYQKLGSTYNPKSLNELPDLMKEQLPPLGREGAMIYGYWEVMRGVLFKYFEPIGLFGGKFRGRNLDDPDEKRPIKKMMERLIFRIVRKIKKLGKQLLTKT